MSDADVTKPEPQAPNPAPEPEEGSGREGILQKRRKPTGPARPEV